MTGVATSALCACREMLTCALLATLLAGALPVGGCRHFGRAEPAPVELDWPDTSPGDPPPAGDSGTEPEKKPAEPKKPAQTI